ncbi:MAG: ABC transporter ATP-binding protein [Myxococcota bacterium]
MTPADVALDAQAVLRRYGTRVAVAGISLRVVASEIVAIIGPNGAGKTTLLEVLAGVARAESGRVAAAGAVGYCPQDNLHWGDLTPREQLIFLARTFGLRRPQAAARAEALLDQLGLDSHADVLASTLSGGMQRRLNLASGLVHRPRVLILDEPTAGLDPENKAFVHTFLREETRSRGAAVLLSTHDFAEAEALADRVAILDRGRVVALETPARLMARIEAKAVVELVIEVGEQRPLLQALEAAGLPYRLDGALISIEVSELASGLEAVAKLLRRTRARPRSLSSRPRSLGDVFWSITGRRAET